MAIGQLVVPEQAPAQGAGPASDDLRVELELDALLEGEPAPAHSRSRR